MNDMYSWVAFSFFFFPLIIFGMEGVWDRSASNANVSLFPSPYLFWPYSSVLREHLLSMSILVKPYYISLY